MIVGLKFRRTPYSFHTMATATRSPFGETTGTGNSPPARKLACWPSIAIRFGSARLRIAPTELSARRKPVRPASPLPNRMFRGEARLSRYEEAVLVMLVSRTLVGELPEFR